MKRLEQYLNQIDGKGYKGYKIIQGSYQFDTYRLHIDHVQGDPFASPSRIRIEIPYHVVNIKREWYDSAWRKTATEDFLARLFARAVHSLHAKRIGTGKSGLIAIDSPGQEIMERTAVRLYEDRFEVRLSIGLPAQGRRILGKEAIRLFFQVLPKCIQGAYLPLDEKGLADHLKLSDQQQAIREYIQKNGLVAFVGNGAILPRASGVSNKPMPREKAVIFRSPPELEVEIPLPDGETIRGMGIPQGVTLIVGGGYHGKSTLLKALERGVYNHVADDGRQFVITDPRTVKVRAEDGRRVEKVNISPFINNLPFGQGTDRFSTEDASGSTSQAANIMEALEMGAKVLLIDEDTSATNFMIRDARMQQLVHKGKEPITPFVDKVRQLYQELGVSTILVLGGSGDYFDQADHVIMMDHYLPRDVTKEAKAIAEKIRTERQGEGGRSFGAITERVPLPEPYGSLKGKKAKIEAKGLHTIRVDKESLDLKFVEQLVDPSQTRAIALMITWLYRHAFNGSTTLRAAIEQLYDKLEKESLDMLSPYRGKHPGDLALPRPFELAQAINRLRGLKVK